MAYAEVLDSVNRIAHGFLNLGVRKGDKVAILLPNCLEFPYCWLAANMIGAVMVPVNNRFVGDEAKYILNHSEAKVLVTSNGYREMISGIRNGLPFLNTLSILIIIPEKEMSPTPDCLIFRQSCRL